MMTTQIKTILVVLTLLIGWTLMIASIPAYALFWRVDNEPGAAKIPELLWTAICFLTPGGLIFISAHISLLIHKSRAILIAWAICLAIGVMACSLSPVLFLFMV